MSAAELAAVLCGVVALVATAALAVVCVRLDRAVRALREVVETCEARLTGAADRAERAASEASAQVDRLDRLIHTADAVSERADAAMKVLANPVIKGAAAASGTRTVARRLRGRRAEQTSERS